MTDLRKAAKQLLEQLEQGWVQRDDWVAFELRQALAQPEQEHKYKAQSEAVWLNTNGRMRIDPVTGDVSIGTSRKEWIGLSDEQLDRLLASGQQIMDIGKTPSK